MSPCHCSVASVSRQAGEDGVVAPPRRQLDRQHADLRRRPGVDARHRGAEASSCTPRHEPQNGTPRSTASRMRAFSSTSHGMLGLVVDAHRAAHGDDRVEAVEPGQRLALVELDAVQVGAPGHHDVLEGAGRLAGDVLEHEDPHAGASIAPGGRPVQCVEGEGDRLVGGERLAFRPCVSEGGFVELGTNSGECLFADASRRTRGIAPISASRASEHERTRAAIFGLPARATRRAKRQTQLAIKSRSSRSRKSR